MEALCQEVDQLRELFARRGRDPVEAQTAAGTFGVDAIEEQHVPLIYRIICQIGVSRYLARHGAGLFCAS